MGYIESACGVPRGTAPSARDVTGRHRINVGGCLDRCSFGLAMSIGDIISGVERGALGRSGLGRRAQGRAAGPGLSLARRRRVFEAVERIDDPREALPSEPVQFPVLEPGDRALIEAGEALKLTLRDRVSEAAPLDRRSDQCQSASDAWIARPRKRIPTHGATIRAPARLALIWLAAVQEVMSPEDIAKRKYTPARSPKSRAAVTSTEAGEPRADGDRTPTAGFRGSVGSMVTTDQAMA
jgi:hypothetical protein